MKVQQQLYQAIKASPMSEHAAWHAARIPAHLVPVPDRAAWQAARDAFPGIVDWNSPGAGRQFLEFHRTMIRHLRWLADRTPNLTSNVAPWADLPGWLTPHLPSRFISACRDRLRALVNGPSDDDLGGFIEATGRFTELGSGVHNIAHGLIAQIEVKEHLTNPGLIDAGMDDPSTAHHNSHFWGLHGWIDDLYARWQRNHKVLVDQSPLDPAIGHLHAADSHQDDTHAASAHGMPADSHAHSTSSAHSKHSTHSAHAASPSHSKTSQAGCSKHDSHDEKSQWKKEPPPPRLRYDATPGIQAVLRARFNPI